jgi:hypothetical protein
MSLYKFDQWPRSLRAVENLGIKPILFQINLSRASLCVIRWNEKELVHWLELD